MWIMSKRLCWKAGSFYVQKYQVFCTTEMGNCIHVESCDKCRCLWSLLSDTFKVPKRRDSVKFSLWNCYMVTEFPMSITIEQVMMRLDALFVSINVLDPSEPIDKPIPSPWWIAPIWYLAIPQSPYPLTRYAPYASPIPPCTVKIKAKAESPHLIVLVPGATVKRRFLSESPFNFEQSRWAKTEKHRMFYRLWKLQMLCNLKGIQHKHFCLEQFWHPSL